MMLRDYFAHTSPTGSTVYSRIVGTGFVSGYSWLGGETLAWGTGSLASPTSTVNAWLASPEHRAIMLSPSSSGSASAASAARTGLLRRLRLDGRLGQALVEPIIA